MKKRRYTFKAILSVVLSLAMFFSTIQAYALTPVGSSDKGDGTYSNPVIWADVPDNDIIRVGDTYWMSSTTMHMNPGVPIMKSKDMVNWETVSYCYNVLEDNDAMKLQTGGNMYSNGSWASTLRYKDGTFYVIVPSNTTRKTYIFQTEDPENQPWRRYEINQQFHDCGLLMDDDGRNWLVYGGNPLYIIELNETVTGLKAGAQARVILENIHAPNPEDDYLTPTGSGLAEGAHIRKIDGVYYILCITSEDRGWLRQQVCHRSTSLEGPWEAKVVARESISGSGVGQGDIVDDGNGNWYGMIFRDSGAAGRIPWLMPITWVDGWPMFGKDGSYTNIPREGEIPIQTDTGTKSVVSSDEFYNNESKPVYYASDITPLPTVSTASIPVTTSLASASTTAGTGISTLAAVGDELVVNGDFEDTDMSMWTSNDTATVTRTDAQKASGSYGAYVTGRTTTGSGPAQNVLGKMVKGGVYSVSFKVYYDEDTAPGSPVTKTFNFNVKGGGSYSSSYNPIRIMRGGSAAKGRWTTISGQYTMEEDLDLSVTSVFVETNWAGSPSAETDLFNFYVDDLSVKVVSEPEPPGPTQIIENGDFEDEDMSMWTSNDTAAVTRTDAQKAAGSYSAYVTGRTTTGSGPAQDVVGKMVNGGTYDVSFKVYYDEATAPSSPGTKTFNYNIKGGGSYSSSYNPVRVMKGASAAKGQWTTISGQYTVPDDLDMSVTSVFVETGWSGSPDAITDLFNFYVDDLSVELVSLPSDPDPDDEFQWGGEYLYNGSNLNLAWQWNHNPNNRYWSLTERMGWLRLRTGFTAKGILSAPNTLTQRTFGPQSAAVTVLDVTNMKAGDEAGISLFTAKYGSIGVKMEGTSKYIVTTLANSWTNSNGHATDVGTESARIQLTGDKVYLKAEANFLNQTDKGNFYYSLDGRTWTKLGGELNMTYSTSNHFMGYRFALYNFARTTTGGYVDFDYFRLDDKLTGATAPTILSASMTDQTGVSGVAGSVVNVPVLLDPLPDGNYSEIAASFNIPSNFTVTGVTFSENVAGEKSWNVNGNQLELEITGNEMGFRPDVSSMFATITLKLNKSMAANTTLSVVPDYVIVKGGGDVVYNTDNVKSDVVFTAVDSGKAYAKKIGYSNSIISHKYGADPFAMVYDGRVYVYMTDDEAQYQATPDTANSYGNCRSINIISSDDMVNWVDHGSVPVGKQLANGLTTWASNAWAPAAAHKMVDGKEKFFLYFADNASGIGVLTADSPIGPFEDPLGKALIGPGSAPAQGVHWLFDPAVMVDDDGTGYLYYGGGIPSGGDYNQPGTERVIKLKDNMIETDGSAAAINAPGIFEDSGIHKYNGIYYYSYCSNFQTNVISTGTIHYMVSNNPMGPFTYVGAILPGPGGLGSQGGLNGDGGNNHHAIFEFNNKWYITYHTRQVNLAERLDQGLTGNRDYRSPSITELTYDSTGKIVPTVMEMPGVSQIAALNPYERIEAETIGWNYGIKTAKTSQTGSYVSSINMAVTKIHNGDWIGNGQVDFGSRGAAALKVNAAGRAGGKIEIRLDTLDGRKIGEIDVPAGSGEEWQQLQTSVEDVTGVHNLFFKYTGSGTEELFDVDYWQFVEKAGSGEGTLEEAVEEAKNAAEEALAAAQAAKEDAERAKDEADAAALAASDAADEAEKAQEAADAAKMEAEKAQKAADDAKTEAENAKGNKELAEMAQKKAEDAQKAAEEAAEAAVAAQEEADNAKEVAEAAKNDAVTAKEAAERAQEAAEGAQQKAETAQEAAEAAARAVSEDAEKVQEALAEALEAAEEAKADAQTAAQAKTAAETARTDAETAKTAAETARTGAEAARTEAVAAKTLAQAAADAAETARIAAEAAQAAAEAAQAAAEAAKAEAEAAKEEAKRMKEEAEAAKAAAEAAKEAAEAAKAAVEKAEAEFLKAKAEAAKAKAETEEMKKAAQKDADALALAGRKVKINSAKNSKSKKIAVKWKKDAKAVGYQIQRSLKATFTGKKVTKNTSKTSYTISGLKKSKTYYIRVRAYTEDSKGKKVYGQWSKARKVVVSK